LVSRLLKEKRSHVAQHVQGVDDGIGYGVQGQSTGAPAQLVGPVVLPGETGAPGIGVWGDDTGPGIGVFGSSAGGVGVFGQSNSPTDTISNLASSNVGVIGSSVNGDGIFGVGARNGIHGQTASAADSGVWGENKDAGAGVGGSSVNGNGVVGSSESPANSGVWGFNTGGGTGVAGSSTDGNGVTGSSANAFRSGVWGNNTGAGVGVAGSSVSGNAGEFTGNVLVTGTLSVGQDVVLTGADCAEQFDSVGDRTLEPGTVVVIDLDGSLRESCDAYDRKAAGIVSGAGEYRPGIVLDRRESDSGRIVIALIGKVYCKVDAGYAPIELGDLLTTSPTPGHAMKASDPGRAFGAVVGKALRPLPGGRGLVPVLVALQ
jgi:hypothetical protein